MSKNFLTEDELAICNQMGVSADDFWAARKSEMKAALCREDAVEEAKVNKLFGVDAADADFNPNLNGE